MISLPWNIQKAAVPKSGPAYFNDFLGGSRKCTFNKIACYHYLATLKMREDFIILPQKPARFFIAVSNCLKCSMTISITLLVWLCACSYWYHYQLILVPRGRAPFGQHKESRPLARANTGSPRFTDFQSLCACSESSLTNLIGSGLNLLCLHKTI